MAAAVSAHELVDQLQAAVACSPGLNKHHVQLLPDLLAVLCGLRPLVLLDYVVTCPRELQGLVARCPALQAWPGCILELARCCCFAHLPALLASSRARLEQLQHDCNHQAPQQHHQHQQQQQQHQEQHTGVKEAVDRKQGPAADPPAPCFLVYSPHGWSLASQQQLQVVCQQLGVLQQALEQLQGPRGPPCAGGGPPASQAQQQVSGVTPPPLAPCHALEATAGACLDQQDEWQQAGPRRRGRKGGHHSQSLATNATPTAPGQEGVVPINSSGGVWPVLSLDHLPGLPALPTLNGWLLEYPAVYLVHTVEEATATSRAMSSGKLQLHTLRGQLHSKVCSQLRAGDASHVLCAFSVPEAMHGDGMVQERVQQLVNTMQQRLIQGTSTSTQVASSSTTTTGSAGMCTGVVDAASCWLDITISRQWVGPRAVTL